MGHKKTETQPSQLCSYHLTLLFICQYKWKPKNILKIEKFNSASPYYGNYLITEGFNWSNNKNDINNNIDEMNFTIN